MTDSAAWMSIREAVKVTGRSRMTIWRWAEAGYVRSMKPGSRVILCRSDVTETEQAIFDGGTPEKRT